MKKITYGFIISTFLFTCSSRKLFDHEYFEIGISTGVLDNSDINEASGLAASINNPGMFWTHNDSGDGARIFLITEKGQCKAEVTLKKTKSRDWEDISVGPGPEAEKTYVYIGDIGDNFALHEYKYIYRIEEPALKPNENSKVDTTIRKVDSIRFRLPDGPRDTEALMIDPETRNLYIFSKREQKVNLYVLPYPQDTENAMTAQLVMQIPFPTIVAADISGDGREVIIKNYTDVYYWVKGDGNESLEDLLKTDAHHLPYVAEPQGESIAFKRDGTGYYTLSESAHKHTSHMIFYKRRPL